VLQYKSLAQWSGLVWDIPLLPGTRTMYKTRGSRAWCVGFRGYCGGFANKFVREESERASIGGAGMCMKQRYQVLLSTFLEGGKAKGGYDLQ